jgi:hypothetical protein
MTNQHEETMAQASQMPTGDFRRYEAYAMPRHHGRDMEGSLIGVGLLALVVGGLAWYYLGPDIKRYMRIRAM